MNNQPNRFGTDNRHAFHGSAIDRAKPLRFRLNGRVIDGFAGDTILSAALASGVESAGMHLGHPLALDERFAPVVVPVARRNDPAQMLPMDRMPASAGLDLLTLGAQDGRAAGSGLGRWIEALFKGPRRTLGLHFDNAPAIAGPWVDEHATLTLKADLLIVGGGIAGLSAARVAVLAGEKVVIVERRPTLGGDAPYFGTFGDEEAPEKLIARLADGLSHAGHVTILTRTEAFALIEGGIRAHHIETVDGKATGRVIDIKSTRIVLATGALERLPVFPGNRAPGVGGTVAAFHRASQYGVWLGRKTAISTSSSFAYRLATKVTDAGIDVLKLADIRLRPQSRFIEFSKAYGITMAPGIFVRDATPERRNTDGLSLRFDVAIEGIHQEIEPLWAEQLLVCGGWQPDLTLWHMAGGTSRWVPHSGQLQARGRIEGIELVGAAAGYHHTSACIASGEAGAAWLFGRPAADAVDPVIEAIYETPDAPAPISPADQSFTTPAYLDFGHKLVTRPIAEKDTRGWLPFAKRRQTHVPLLAQQAHGLGIGEVAAGVQIGALPERAAGIVARERGVNPGDIASAGRDWKMPQDLDGESPAIPPYLAGRFGPAPKTWIITAEDGRLFEPGCLIYVNSDSSDPRHAVGVVIGRPADRKGSLALIGKTPVATGDRLVAKDISGAAPVKLEEIVGSEPAVRPAPTEGQQ